MKNIFLISILFVLSISTGCEPESPEDKFVKTLSENIKESDEWENISKPGEKFQMYRNKMYRNKKRQLVISLYITKKSYEKNMIYIRSITDKNASLTFLHPSANYNILYDAISNKHKFESLNKLSKTFLTDSVTTSEVKP